MYRFPHKFVVATLVTLVAGTAQGQSQPTSRTPASRQPASRQAAEQPVTGVTEPVSAELNKLLTDWSASSDRIEQLHGKHQRRVYDLAFETERISQGEFGYQKPDKGRITMTPMKITKELLASRNRPDARVERKRDGTPFDLRPDNPERWLCDGERVYDIDEAAKGPVSLGDDSETGMAVYVLNGRFGAYVQLGEMVDGEDKPKRASLFSTMTPETVTLEDRLLVDHIG